MAAPSISVRPYMASSGPLVELASGVDAMYLSGRGELPRSLVEELVEGRRAADEAEGPVPFMFGGLEFGIQPRSFGKYKYSLIHSLMQIGVTTSASLPALRVQPRAELLHGLGPEAALSVCRDLGDQELGDVIWSLSRLDLFCDVQGWDLVGDDRHRFVARSRRRDTHEEGDEFTGFEFGRRATKTVCARIYDKTLQITKSGKDWWIDKWGEDYDPSLQVLRVEFEIGRQGLVEFGMEHPEVALCRAAGVWAGLTEDWLSYRSPTSDATKSRWPVAIEWESIQRASLRGDALGLDRVRNGKGAGSLRRITPALVGYLARMAFLAGANDVESSLGALRCVVADDEVVRGIHFSDRVAALVEEDRFR
ncbi:MAG: hypothetical protein WCG62_04590 [Actinomycetes bacterium]